MDSDTTLSNRLNELVQDIIDLAKKPKVEHSLALDSICEQILDLKYFARDNTKEIKDTCQEILSCAVNIEEKGVLREDLIILKQAEIEGLNKKILSILMDETPHKN